METNPIPSSDAVRQVLQGLSRQQLLRLAELSSVPFTTVQKIARGETVDPRLDTVRAFMPHVKAATKTAAQA